MINGDRNISYCPWLWCKIIRVIIKGKVFLWSPFRLAQSLRISRCCGIRSVLSITLAIPNSVGHILFLKSDVLSAFYQIVLLLEEHIGQTQIRSSKILRRPTEYILFLRIFILCYLCINFLLYFLCARAQIQSYLILYIASFPQGFWHFIKFFWTCLPFAL